MIKHIKRPDDYFVVHYVKELDERIWNPNGPGLVFPVFYGRNNFNEKNVIHMQNGITNRDYFCCSLLHIGKDNKVYPGHYHDKSWNFAYELDRSKANFTKASAADLVSCSPDYKSISQVYIDGKKVDIYYNNNGGFYFFSAEKNLDYFYYKIDREIRRVMQELANYIKDKKDITKQQIFDFVQKNSKIGVFKLLTNENISIRESYVNIAGFGYLAKFNGTVSSLQGYNEILAQPHNLLDGKPNDKDILQIKRLVIDVDNNNLNETKQLVDENYDKIVEFVQNKTTKHDIRIIDKNTKKTQIMRLEEFLAMYSTKYPQQQYFTNITTFKQKPITTNYHPAKNFIKENYIYNNRDINNYSNQQLQQQIQQQNYQYQPKMQNINPTIQQFAPRPNYIQQKPITSTTITQPAKTIKYSPQPVYPIYTKPQTYYTIPTTTTNNIPIKTTGYTQDYTFFSSLNSGRPLIYNGMPQYYTNIMSNTINNPYIFK